MLNYLIRRLFLAVLTLVFITFLVYGLVRAMPGGPVSNLAAEIDPSKALDEEDLEELRRYYGLDKPWYTAYWIWLGNLVQGDMSTSFLERKPVSEVIGRRVGPTLLLSGTSLLLTYILSVPLGLFATVRSGKLDERGVSTLLYMLYSFPTFVAALLLQLAFAVKLQGTAFELPLGGIVSNNHNELSFVGKIGDILQHMILPVVCFTYGSLAYFSRFVKANMAEVVRQDYIRTARAKGVGGFSIIVKHAFRNTMIPFVTLVGLTLPALLSGSVILEYIFNWPGIGKLFFEAISFGDPPLVVGLTLIFSSLTLAGQLLADILYAFVDPRISYS